MPRTMLTDKRWEKLLQLMKNTGRIYNKSEHRMTFEGILYRLRTGISWRDLPTEFGDWNTVYRRLNLWSKKGRLDILFNELSKLSDYEWVFADGSIVKAHQYSAGAATPDSECIGKAVETTQLRFIWSLIVVDCQFILSHQKVKETTLLAPRA